MDDQFQEDWLDTRLREEAPYIDDGGFTARVIQQLPTRRARSFRAAIIFCVTLLGSAITYSVSDGGKFMIAAVNRLAVMPIWFVCLIAICCGLVMTAIATGAALSKVRERALSCPTPVRSRRSRALARRRARSGPGAIRCSRIFFPSAGNAQSAPPHLLRKCLDQNRRDVIRGVARIFRC